MSRLNVKKQEKRYIPVVVLWSQASPARDISASVQYVLVNLSKAPICRSQSYIVLIWRVKLELLEESCNATCKLCVDPGLF